VKSIRHVVLPLYGGVTWLAGQVYPSIQQVPLVALGLDDLTHKDVVPGKIYYLDQAAFQVDGALGDHSLAMVV
jgi:hypothetical protein